MPVNVSVLVECQCRPGLSRSVNERFTGLAHHLGQLQASIRDFHSTCWTGSRILGQPCGFQVVGGCCPADNGQTKRQRLVSRHAIGDIHMTKESYPCKGERKRDVRGHIDPRPPRQLLSASANTLCVSTAHLWHADAAIAIRATLVAARPLNVRHEAVVGVLRATRSA